MLGRLTSDPAIRYTSGNNTAVANFTLAVNRRFVREGQPQADFINIVAWDKTADFVAKYFVKGQQVAVIGRIQTRTWDDNNGQRHYITEVVAEEVFFADSKRNSDSGGTTQRTDTGGNMTSGDGFYPIDEDSDELPF